MLAGCAGSLSAAISDTAASAATVGWQIATRCESGPMRRMNDITCSTYSAKPKRPADSGTSRGLCQSVMYTSWSASIARTVPRSSVAKWPDIGATISTRGCGVAVCLRKCSSEPNGVRFTNSSVTATVSPSTCTVPMPHGGRLCVRPVISTVSQHASR